MKEAAVMNILWVLILHFNTFLKVWVDGLLTEIIVCRFITQLTPFVFFLILLVLLLRIHGSQFPFSSSVPWVRIPLPKSFVGVDTPPPSFSSSNRPFLYAPPLSLRAPPSLEKTHPPPPSPPGVHRVKFNSSEILIDETFARGSLGSVYHTGAWSVRGAGAFPLQSTPR